MKKLIAVLTLLLFLCEMVSPAEQVWAAPIGVNITNVKASIDADQLVLVTGFISSGEGTQITIAITDPDGRPEYLNTVASGDSGNFTFSYTLQNEKPGKYNVTLGAAGLNRLAETSFYYGSNADLKSLSTSLPRLDSTFSPDKTSYTATVDSRIESCTVTPTAYDSSSKITINGSAVLSRTVSGEVLLLTGENTIRIVATAPDGTQKTYSIVITRTEEVITSIEASAQVDNNRLVTVSGTLSSGSAQRVSVKILDPQNNVEYVDTTVTTADGKYELKYGMNNPIAGRYSVLVGAIGAKLPLKTCYFDYGTDAALTKLYLNSINLSQPFKSNVADYTAEVGKELATTNVTAIASDSAAKISVNGAELKSGKQSESIKLSEGLNKICITVTAQDGVIQKTYNIEVTKNINTDVKTDVEAKINKKKIVSISGRLSGTNSRHVSVVVRNPEGEINYLNSTTISKDMDFTFEYAMTGKVYGKYSVTIGIKGLTTIASTYFIFNPQSADLKTLVLNNALLNEPFVADKILYHSRVEETTDSVSVVPTAETEDTKIKVNGSVVKSGETSGSIQLSSGTNTINIVVISEDEIIQKTYTLYIERIASAPPAQAHISSDAALVGLAVSSGELTPVFNPNTTDYGLTVEASISSMIVTPTVREPHATVTANGKQVASGHEYEVMLPEAGEADTTTTVNMVVTAQDGTTKKSYTVNINKKAQIQLSSDAALVGLAVSTGELTPVFNPDTTDYGLTVDANISSMIVTPTVREPHATVTSNGKQVASGQEYEVMLPEAGEADTTTTVNMVVTAQDGTTKKSYTVTITKTALSSSDAALVGLAVSSGELTPVFNPNTTDYGLTVEASFSSMIVTPTVREPHATVTANGKQVASGQEYEVMLPEAGEADTTTTVNMVVTAQDGTTKKSYTVTITKSASLAFNSKLDDLIITTMDNPDGGLTNLIANFDGSTTDYTIEVPSMLNQMNNGVHLNITPVLEEQDVTFELKVSDPDCQISEMSDGNTGRVLSYGLSLEANMDSVKQITATITTHSTNMQRTSVYTIHLNLLPPEGLLQGLSISSGAMVPAFRSSAYEYDVTLGAEVSTLTLTPTVNSNYDTTYFLASDNATIKITTDSNSSYTSYTHSGVESGDIPLGATDTTITVNVRMYDDTYQATYIIHVRRPAANNAFLKDLAVFDGTLTPSFNYAIDQYDIIIGSGVSNLSFKPVAAESVAGIEMSGNPVISASSGEHVSFMYDYMDIVNNFDITITVKALDTTTTKIYTVHVIKEQSP